MAQYRDLNDFLRKHRTTEKVGITHTRIGNGGNVLPGKFIIGESETSMFYKLYHKHVFVEKNNEYLTEVQLKSDKSPLLVDLDFRYDINVDERKHCKDHIDDTIQLYVEEIIKVVDLFNNSGGVTKQTIPVYVLEKPNINTKVEGVVKDGIHIIFGIGMDNTTQMLIRNNVLKHIGDVLDDLELTNDYESVLDDGISKGHTNWQMYGSRKPDNEAYEIKYVYNVEIDKDEEPTVEVVEVDELNTLSLLNKMSARHKYNITGTIKDECKEAYEQIKNKTKQKPKKSKMKTKLKFTQEGFNFDVGEIKNVDMLESMIEKMFSELSTDEYHVKETHDFLMTLPSKYYDSYNEWIRCGWALHNTDFRLFLSWMFFSSQSEKFSFTDIPGYYDEWINMEDEGLTNWSIMYWSKESNPLGYKEIHKRTIDYYVNISISSGTEWDITNVLYHLFKDQYRCASVKYKSWYRFKQHRWEEIDSGTSLRYSISKVLARLYSDKASQFMTDSVTTNIEPTNDTNTSSGNVLDNGSKNDKSRDIATALTAISINLKKTSFKQNIMKEAADVFSQTDPKFLDNLDNNPDLMCFTNGIIDFKEKIFRPGRPEDNISLCTHIKYIPYENLTKKQLGYVDEIKDFMKQLFPIPELNKYMWEHLASVLIGRNVNQTFNIYNGSGSNGKSKLVELMTSILGDYKGEVPITLVTQKRGQIGGLSPEIAKLKGIRYAVMQEPSKGDSLNEGIMKELTGEDPISGRALYKDTVTFIPQFSLCVCTNTLFEIKSSEDGTWRRIRLCDFLSKFKKEPQPDEETPFQFDIDPNIGKKFSQWKEVFMSMLVKIAFETEGIVKDCDMVLAASNEYRKGQDYLMEFKTDKIEKINDPTCKIKKNEVYAEFKIWYQETYGKSVPKGKELYEFLDKKLGKYKNGWTGYRIKYDADEELDQTFNDDEY